MGGGGRLWRDGDTRERWCSMGCSQRTFNFVDTEVVTIKRCSDEGIGEHDQTARDSKNQWPRRPGCRGRVWGEAEAWRPSPSE